MTVDSRYLGPSYSLADGGVEHTFEHESVGAVAFEIWVVEADGTRTKLLNFDVPANALLDTEGNPILDTDGNYILWV